MVQECAIAWRTPGSSDAAGDGLLIGLLRAARAGYTGWDDRAIGEHPECCQEWTLRYTLPTVSVSTEAKSNRILCVPAAMERYALVVGGDAERDFRRHGRKGHDAPLAGGATRRAAWS